MRSLVRQRFWKRIRRIELSLSKQSVGPIAGQVYRTQEEWLDQYESDLELGVFAHEPEFSKAVERFRNAIRDAKSTSGDPFEPPPHFQPQDSLRDRRLAWRRSRTYKDVNRAFNWMTTFSSRRAAGLPPITEAEYEDLQRWFQRNDAHIRTILTATEYEQEIAGNQFRFMEPWGTHRVNSIVADLRDLKVKFTTLT